MGLLRLLKTKYGIGLGIAMLTVAIAIGSYQWYYRFGFAHAPDINLTTLNAGRTLNLKQLEGKPILLTFWASNCPQCLHEMPQLKKLHQELAPKGLHIVAVAVYWDKLDRLRALVHSKNLPYPVTYDGNKAMFRAVNGYHNTPTTFIINPQGRVVMKRVGEMNIAAVRKMLLAMLENK